MIKVNDPSLNMQPGDTFIVGYSGDTYIFERYTMSWKVKAKRIISKSGTTPLGVTTLETQIVTRINEYSVDTEEKLSTLIEREF